MTAVSAADPTTSARALALRGVTKVYPGRTAVRAVDGIDLTVQPGELFGLLGPNGAGKSTTIGMCTTRIRPTSGSVEVVGLDVRRRGPEVKRHLGVVTQDNTLDRSLTLLENLHYHCRYFGWGARRARARAEELLERFRLTERADALPMQISGGMAQRLQVARAVAHEPDVLFLDEPTAGLDPQSRLALWELVRELRDDGLTVVLTTHHMEEADALCDRVAIVDHGRVLVCDTPEALKAAHAPAVTVDLVLEDAPDDALLARLREVVGVTEVVRAASGLRVVGERADGLLPRVVAATEPAPLRDLSVGGATLEAVFVHLTGRELRD